MTDSAPPQPPPASSESPGAEPPRYRPSDQFWPYANLQEEPSDEELARLDPDLQAVLYGNPPAARFSYTVVFAPFDGAGYDQAVALARESSEYLEVNTVEGLRHRARYLPDQALALRRLWQIVGDFNSSDVLIDDRPVPYARELWLPLLWYLIPR
jgi:hypothetical protein